MLRLPQSPRQRLFIALPLVLLPACGLLIVTAICGKRKESLVADESASHEAIAALSRAPMRPLVKKRHEEEEDAAFLATRQRRKNKATTAMPFPADNFTQATLWLNAQPDKKLPDHLKRQEVSWRVKVNEVSDWGVSFCLENGVGLATTRNGFYARINRYTTAFRGDVDLKSLHSGDMVRVTGEVVEAVGTFGMTAGWFFVLENWAARRDPDTPPR